MAPGCRRQLRRIVVAISGPVKAIRGQLVPLLARPLASLAADADGGVGEKAGGRLGLRRFTMLERISQAPHQLRHRAARRIADLNQPGQLHFSTYHLTCHVPAFLPAVRSTACSGSDRASARVLRSLSVPE